MSAKFEGKVVLVAGGTVAWPRREPGIPGRRSEGCRHVSKTGRIRCLEGRSGVNGSQLEGNSVDVTDEAAVRQLIEKILAKHGRLTRL